ncbi:MAG: tetratricopeptide repeat protein [Planctomycetota bacterium]
MPHTHRSKSLAVLLVAFAAAIGACRITPDVASPADQSERLRDGYRLMTDAARADEAGRTQDAIRLYREAVGVAPELAAAWSNLGVLYQRQSEYPAAAECYQRAANHAPSDPRPSTNLGVLYQSRDYYEPALEHFREALRRDPNYLPALRGAVRTAAVLERRDQQLLEWTERGILIEQDPEWLEVFQRQRISTQSVIEKGLGT